MVNHSAMAQTTWTGAVSNVFSGNANWTSNTPTTTGTGVFTGNPATVTNQPTLTGTSTVGGLSFTTATGGWTISDGGSGELRLNSDFGIRTIGQTSGTNIINTIVRSSANTSVIVGTGGTLIINGALTNAAAANLWTIGQAGTGAGTLVLNAVSTRTGTATWAAGTIQAGADNVLGSANGSRAVVADSASVTLASTNATSRSLGNTFTLGNSSVLTLGGSGTLTLSRVISGSGSLVVNGAGILTGANTFIGTTTVNSGATLQLGDSGSSGNLASTGAGVVLNAGSTLKISRTDTFTFNTTDNPLTGSGTVVQIGSGQTNFSGSASTAFSGNLHVVNGVANMSSAAALGGNGNTGTWTVDSGAALRYASTSRTRAGNTVNNGSIQMSNATTSNGLTFSAGTVLLGTGTFQASTATAGTADFSFGGTVAPGATTNAAGKFTIGDGSVATAVQFLSTSTIAWNLTGTGGVAGTNYDSFDLLGGSTVSLVNGASLNIALVYGWSEADAYWQQNHTYSLFSTNAVAGTLTVLNGSYIGGNGSTGTFTFDGQNIQYVYTVPEPKVWGLIFVGVALCLFRARKRLV